MTGLELGGATTLTTAIDQFRAARGMDGFVYAGEFYKHFRRVACLSVRNVWVQFNFFNLKYVYMEFI